MTNRVSLFTLFVLLCFVPVSMTWAQDRDDLAYLTKTDPWYPHAKFPKLTTPQWVGEKGVDAVVILAIDDMRGSGRYESYLRPILNRLKKIDGRSPVSIMTNSINTADPQLQRWLKEGLSIEVHTVDHPCPLLNGGNFARAKSTYDRCIDMLNRIPNNQAVAFRMPCCDSLNTVSPRFYSEIFDKRTPKGSFLQISSSVFNLFTPADKSIPREFLYDKQGRERFTKYVPHQRNRPPRFGFNNFIENYPYPYTINGTCWEFPCVVPSDWEGQNLHRPFNPITLSDMKAALDITVHKKGTYCLVFHPHGWIHDHQVISLLDHAISKYGKRVKFLNFPEALARINKHLLKNNPLRDKQGRDNGVRLVDVNQDGHLDVLIGNKKTKLTRVWDPKKQQFNETSFDMPLTPSTDKSLARTGVHYMQGKTGLRMAYLRPLSGFASGGIPSLFSARRFAGGKWVEDKELRDFLYVRWQIGKGGKPTFSLDNLAMVKVRRSHGRVPLVVIGKKTRKAYAYLPQRKGLRPVSIQLPQSVIASLAERNHPRVRFVDLNDDGENDVVHSPPPVAGKQGPLEFFLMDWTTGKSTSVSVPDSVQTMPIVRADGSNNGFFVRDRNLCWQNEDTNRMPNLLLRASFDAVLHDYESQRARAGKFPTPRSPEQSAQLIKTKPGLRVELVASEPLIRDPVAFDWDPTGRLWVLEMGDYPLGTGTKKKGGRIRVLVDQDKDGRYDSATTFLDNIGFPTGIQHWRNGVLVTAAPEIFYAEDSNGDGKADIRKTLYRGFAEGNQQHRVNGLRWGLDNWLRVANGDSGGSIQPIEGLLSGKKKKATRIDIRGRDMRIRPDQGLLDPQSGQAQFGRNRDDWGNWFGCNNSNPMWQYVLEDHTIRANPHAAVRNTRHVVPVRPGAAPVFPISRTLPRYNDFGGINRFTSACSTIVYRDNKLGSGFNGNAFTSEPVHNLISRLVLTRQGITYRGNRAVDEGGSEFLASRDNWFRPTMIRTGPDGALWIADMYRAVIEHPKWIPGDWQKRMNLRAGHQFGRIYRVVPAPEATCCGKQEVADPDDALRSFFNGDKVASGDWVKRLGSPNGWWRDTAQRMLVHRQDKSVVPALKRLALASKRATARLHAMCTLDGLQVPMDTVLMTLLEDPHPGVRRHAVRIAAARKRRMLDSRVARRIEDQDDAVRLQLANSARHLAAETGGRVLGVLLSKNSKNPWIRSASLSSLTKQNVSHVLKEVMKYSPSRAFLATMLGQAGAFGEIDAIKDALVRILPKKGQSITPQQWATLSMVSGEIQRHKALRKVFASADVKARWQQTQQQAKLIVLDSKQAIAVRVTAMRFAGAAGDQKQLLELGESLLVPQTPYELQRAAVQALASTGASDVPKTLTAGWRGHGPAVRVAILDALIERSAYRDTLLKQLQAGTIKPVDIDAVRRDRLTRTGSKQQQASARKLLAVTRNTNRAAVVEKFAGVAKLMGDVSRGRMVFKKRCSACHRLSGMGRSIGADLTALRDKSTRSLLTAILDPNRAVEAKFLTFNVLTKKGRSLSGMLLTETGNSITLVAADGKEQVIARQNLDRLFSTNRSLMPEGFERDLSKRDFADVIRFLQSNSKPRKKFPNNVPRVIASNAKGILVLPATAAEIYGPSIVLEQRYKNLGYWSSKQDHADWTINVAKGGRYRVEFDYAVHRSAAGDEIHLTVAGKTIKGRVPSTGVWDNYRVWKVGEIELPKGISRLIVGTPTKPKQAMIDLRTIRLIPIK